MNKDKLIQKKITMYFKHLKNNKKIYGYNLKTYSWHCLECGKDMGSNNPRQLCGKYYCKNIINF